MKTLMIVPLLLTLFVLPVFGQSEVEKEDKESLVTMEEVMVTGTRDKEEIRRVPANVTVITADEIEKAGATNIVEVLEKLGSIKFRTFSGNPSQAYIDMRGFGGDNPYGKTLIMLDGRRLNRPDMASVNWLQIPVNNIERIEVVRGASNVLYGDSAVAGVINIITKRGLGRPKLGASVIAGSYGLVDGRSSITGSTAGLSYALTGEIQEISGYRDRSEFSSKGGGVNLGYDLTEYFGLSLGYSYNKTYFQLPGNLSKAEMAIDRKQYQPARGWWAAHPNDYSDNEYQNADLRVETILGDFGRFDMNLSYGNKNIRSHMESNWAPNKYNVGDMDTVAIAPKYILEADIFGHANKLILGLDYYHETLDIDKYNERARALQSRTHVVDFEKNSVGYYIRDDFNVFERLIVSGGFRWEQATIKGSQTTLATMTEDFDGEKDYRGKAYEGGLTLLIGKKSKIFAKYATVYRYPFLDEQASYWGFGTDRFFHDMEKEQGKSYDLGTQFYLLEGLKVGATLFRIDMKDEIAWNNTTNRNENLDKTRHQGAEFSLLFRLPGYFDLYGNYTYHDAEFRNGVNVGKEIPLVPRKMANIGLELYLPFSFGLRSEMRYIDDSYLGTDNDNSSEQLEGYTLYDLFLVYRPGHGSLRVNAFFGVENLTNEEYSTMGYEGNPNVFYPSPGRTIRGGVSITF